MIPFLKAMNVWKIVDPIRTIPDTVTPDILLLVFAYVAVTASRSRLVRMDYRLGYIMYRQIQARSAWLKSVSVYKRKGNVLSLEISRHNHGITDKLQLRVEPFTTFIIWL